MSIHKPILRAAKVAIEQIMFDGEHASIIVEKNLKTQKKWGARDRRQFAEVVYDIVRWWRLYACLAGHDFKSLNFKSEHVSSVLEAYFLDKENPTAYTEKKKSLTFSERESISDWLYSLGHAELKDEWEKTMSSLNQPARQYLRANELKNKVIDLKNTLHSSGVETEIVLQVPNALVLKQRKNVFTTEAYKNGLFEMQDGGSQLIAPFVKAEPGHRVIDACAGAGGKSLHLAAIMKNQGQLIALDVHQFKLDELKKRARRGGVSLIETRLIENNKTIKRLYNSADRVLLDVPCSGLGVLKRHPDTKWKLTQNQLEELHKTQSEILSSYSRMVRPGGKLVYATCSILPSENQSQVYKFLVQNEREWILEEELNVSPFDTFFDGFYAARLVKI